MSEKKRTGNMSSFQKTELISFMEKNSELRSGKFTRTFTFKTSQHLWINLTNSLNSLPGANKTWQQWRKAWHDIKMSTKKKSADINKHRRTTGGGPPLPEETLLKDEEIQVINMIAPVAIEGHLIPESSTSFQYDQPSTLLELDQPSSASEVSQMSTSFSNTESHIVENEVIIEQNPDHVYCGTDLFDKENKSPSITKRSPTKLFQARRLNETISATKKMAEQNEKRIEQKGLYEVKKLELYEQDINVKKRIASALEEIAKKLN